MIDKTLMLRKLSNLDKYLDQIGEYACITMEGYRGDWKVQRIVERTLQMMIETCLDISGHIIADGKFRVPETYADAFRILVENGILSEAHLDAYEKMARFRNIVVHDYERIDPEIVMGLLKNDLQNFEEFKTSVVEYLRQKPNKST